MLSSALWLCGCVEQVKEGNADVFKYALWAMLATVGIGVAMLVGGVVMMTKKKWGPAVGLLILGLLTAVLFGPGLATDKIMVTADGFTRHQGLWFATTPKEIKFDNVKQIEMSTEVKTETKRTKSGQRKTKTTKTEYMTVTNKDGTSEKIQVGTLLKGKGLDLIRQNSKAKGIEFIENEGDDD